MKKIKLYFQEVLSNSLIFALAVVVWIFKADFTVGAKRGGVEIIAAVCATIFFVPLVINLVELFRSLRKYFAFAESFDRRPPVDRAEVLAAEAHVRGVLQQLAGELLGLFKRETGLLDPGVDRSDLEQGYVASQLDLTKTEIKKLKRIVRKAQNSAQFWGYQAPDKLVKIVKCKSIL
jgi:hypothetical protein